MFEVLPTTEEQFCYETLASTLGALKINMYVDNLPTDLNLGGVDESKTFHAYAHAKYFDFFIRHKYDFWKAYSAFDDSCSKSLFLHLIAYRLAGHLSIRIPQEWLASAPPRQAVINNPNHEVPSMFEWNGGSGILKHYDFEWNGHRYIIDCPKGGLDFYLIRDQYFFRREGISVEPKLGDFVIDGGACTGETALVFSNAVGTSGRVFSFDPLADHLEVLKYNIKQFPIPNVIAMPWGLSDVDIDAAPLVLNNYHPGFSVGGNKVPLRTVDSLVASGHIEKVSYIKLDIEGSEMAALRGANKTIQFYKPKMAISLYHKEEDFYEIVNYIRWKYPFYKFFLCHYTLINWETVLYCLPQCD